MHRKSNKAKQSDSARGVHLCVCSQAPIVTHKWPPHALRLLAALEENMTMIDIPQESDFTELSELISASIQGCIVASEVDLRNIENSSIEASRMYLDGQLDGVHLLYRDNNQIQGLILVKDYWNMVSLFVLPTSHRKGIATKLVNDSLKICREKSPKMLVALNSSNYASRFYKNYGFERNGEPHDFPGGCMPYVYRF